MKCCRRPYGSDRSTCSEVGQGSLPLTAQWSPERQVDATSQCLVDWRLLLEPGNIINMVEDSVLQCAIMVDMVARPVVEIISSFRTN